MLVPHLQINVRTEKPEKGSSADVRNTGATLAYLSPGVTVAVTQKLQLYSFVQVPIYQRVTGNQIEPTYSVSAGLHYTF